MKWGVGELKAKTVVDQSLVNTSYKQFSVSPFSLGVNS